MTGSTQRFISELIHAANEAGRLTKLEQANLLQRAAATIDNLRDEINYSETPANDRGTPDDIVFCLNEMAGNVERSPPDHVADALLEAVEVIKAGRVLLDEKRKIEDEQ